MPHDTTTPPSFWRRWRGTLIVGMVAIAAWQGGLIPSLGGERSHPFGEGKAAPDLLVPEVHGQGHLSLASLKGQVVLVTFWATWCPPCRAEIPSLAGIHDRYKSRGFTVLGVAVDRGGATDVLAFLQSRPVPYPVAVSTAEAVTAYGGIRAIPTSFLIDRQGRAVKSYVGMLPGPRLEHDLLPLLASPSGR